MSQQTSDLTADLVIQIKGDAYSVVAGPVLRNTGWRAGLWVQYINPGANNLVDEYMVEVSNGSNVAGFFINSSESYVQGNPFGAENDYTAEQLRTPQGAVAGASTTTICTNGGKYLFRMFETVALTGAGTRTGGAITYVLNGILRVSENGLLCNDSVVNLQAAGVTNPRDVGICSGVPHARNGNCVAMDGKF